MGDMGERVARAMLHDRALSNGFSEKAIDYRFVTEAMRLDASAALEACHFDELVGALCETVRVLKFSFEEGALPEETVSGLCIDPYGMLRDAEAVLVRVTGNSHG